MLINVIMLLIHGLSNLFVLWCFVFNSQDICVIILIRQCMLNGNALFV